MRESLRNDEQVGLRFIKACSYPCEKPDKNPDVTFLAKMGEKEGVDVRVVVTTRAPADVVDVWTVERLTTLAGSCGRLYSQLLAIDPAFYLCVPYVGYGDPAIVRALADFLGVDVELAVRAAYRESARNDTHRLAAASTAVRRAFSILHECSVRLDALCGVPSSGHVVEPRRRRRGGLASATIRAQAQAQAGTLGPWWAWLVSLLAH